MHGDRLEHDYLVCGSFDGKCKITTASHGELIGQLVTQGDDAWGFMDGEPRLEEHHPQVDGEESDEEERAARETAEIFAQLEDASPFYSLMVQSTDLTKRIQPECVLLLPHTS